MVSDFRNLLHVSRQGLSVYHRSFSSFFFGMHFEPTKRKQRVPEPQNQLGFLDDGEVL